LSVLTNTKKTRENPKVEINKTQYRAFVSNFTYFHENYDDMKETYPDSFVAIYEKKVVDHDEDIEALFKRLKEKYDDLSTFVIEYVSTQKVELLL